MFLNASYQAANIGVEVMEKCLKYIQYTGMVEVIGHNNGSNTKSDLFYHHIFCEFCKNILSRCM